MVHQTHQKEKLSRKVQVKQKMGTTTVRSTPNQNQQEKNKKETPSLQKKKWREERKNRRAKRPRTKARWIGEGDGSQLDGRNEAGTKNGEGQEREHQRNKRQS